MCTRWNIPQHVHSQLLIYVWKHSNGNLFSPIISYILNNVNGEGITGGGVYTSED